jgi:hypothetical protein
MEFIPFLGAIVTILFSIAFYLGVQELKKLDD